MIALPTSFGIYGGGPSYSGTIGGFLAYADYAHSEVVELCANLPGLECRAGKLNPSPICHIDNANAFGRALGPLKSLSGKRAFGVRVISSVSISAVDFGLGSNILSGGTANGSARTYPGNWLFATSGAWYPNSALPISLFPTDNFTGTTYAGTGLELLFLVDMSVGSLQIYGPTGWINRLHPTHPNYVVDSGMCDGNFSNVSIVGDAVGIPGSNDTKIKYLGGSDIPYQSQIPSGYVSLDGTVFF